MSAKSLKTRILMKHDTEANWGKAENFIPLPGEIIIYTVDENNEKPRVKIGNGETKVNELPFTTIGIPDIPEDSANLMLTTNENGEMVWEEKNKIDITLTQSGQAADAKAVGDALAGKASYDDIQRYIDEAILGGEW